MRRGLTSPDFASMDLGGHERAIPPKRFGTHCPARPSARPDPSARVIHSRDAETGRYWNVFNANGGRTIDITSGGVSDTLGDYTFGRDYGEVKGNLDMYSLGPGWSAFVNTGVRWNAMWTTVTTKGGLAYRW